MRKALLGALTAVGAGLAGTAAAAPLPQPVADMIAAVADDPAALKTVVAAARKTNPNAIAEIDAQVAALATKAAEAERARLADEGLLEGWTGVFDLGMFLFTGNTDEEGYAASLKLARTSLLWRHTLEVQADYKEEEGGDVTKERYVGTYMGYRRLGARTYAWGRLAYEYDRIAGFDSRVSESVGLGYRAIDRRKLRLDLEAGPALRQTQFSDDTSRDSVAARVAAKLLWTVSRRVTLTQDAAAFLEDGNNTLTATSALTTKLGGAFSARASFDVRYDQNPPPDREKTDTTTRLTLVYDF